MATVNQVPLRIVTPIFRTVVLPEAASQSFKAGQLVYINSGKVTACADDPSSVYGVALQDATGTEDSDILVAIIEADTLLEMNVYHSTSANAVTNNDLIGNEYSLKVANNKCYVDIEDTSNKVFTIVRLSPRDSEGDQYGRVYARVTDAVRQSSA